MKVWRQTEENIGQKRERRKCVSVGLEKAPQHDKYYILFPQNVLRRIWAIICLQRERVYVCVCVCVCVRERQGEPERVSACKCEQYLGLGLRGF